MANKKYIITQEKRIGSNKDGSAKKHHKVNDVVYLSDKKAAIYKSLNII